MLKFTLRSKFLLLSVVFALVLLVEISMIFLLTNDGSQLLEREVPLLTKSHEIKLAVVQVQQFLTDVSATRGQDGLDDGYKEAEKNAQMFRLSIKDLQALDAENQNRYVAMRAAFEKYYSVGKRMADAYRRLRNTARFLLANLNGFDPATDFTVRPWLAEHLDRPLADHEVLVGAAVGISIILNSTTATIGRG